MKEQKLLHTLSVLEVECGTLELEPRGISKLNSPTILDNLISTSKMPKVADQPSVVRHNVDESSTSETFETEDITKDSSDQESLSHGYENFGQQFTQ